MTTPSSSRDWFEAFRNDQDTLADRIATTIIAELEPAHIARNTYAIQTYIPWCVPESIADMDSDTFTKMIHQEITDHTRATVRSYTDWLVHLFAKQTGLVPQPVPAQIDYETIARQTHSSGPLVKKVIDTMNNEPALPLIGAIKEGAIYPNVPALETYIALFEFFFKK